MGALFWQVLHLVRNVSAGLKGIHFRRFALSHLSEGLPWGTPIR